MDPYAFPYRRSHGAAPPRRATAGLLAAVALLMTACSDLPLLPTDTGADAAPRHLEPPSSSPESGKSANPIAAASFYVDTESRARRQADEWRSTRPDDAAQMDKIASQPQAMWLGEWLTDPANWIGRMTTKIQTAGAVPVYVLYNVPQRDCGSYSAGGLAHFETYQQWVAEIARGIGSRRAVVIVEPDAAALTSCLSAEQVEQRFQALRQAVRTLKANPGTTVYMDGGNAIWHPVEEMAARLRKAGVEEADGFALNVSNFIATDQSIRYGEAISKLVGGKHFVIDTSRNGLGPSTPYEWCNPEGRAIGTRPTTKTGHPLVDAFLWVKPPGESDGTCNGGPRAGRWWAEYALGLARRG